MSLPEPWQQAIAHLLDITLAASESLLEGLVLERGADDGALDSQWA